MIIDSHTHAWETWPYQPPVPDPGSRGRVEQLLWEMDRTSVDRAVLVCARIDHNPGNNDYVAACVKRYPDRLVQFADVDCSWTETYHRPGAAQRLAEAADVYALNGFTHYLKNDTGWFDSEEGLEFFGMAAERRLIASLALGAEWQPALRRLARRYPSVPFLCHHMAGARAGHAFAEHLGEILRSADVPNIYVKLSGFHYVSRTAWDYPYPDTRETVRRLGIYEPRTPLEEETMGRAPALVEAGRAQVVLSALRALTAQLGAHPGRPAILLVSGGFAPPPRRVSTRLPDLALVDRFANRYDVPIYSFDPAAAPSGSGDENAATLRTLASLTGGNVLRGSDLTANLTSASDELDGGYAITYTPTHPDDGRFHPVEVKLARRIADSAAARARAGYVSPPSAEMRRAMRTAEGPILPTRMLRRSPLVDVWSGVTRITASQARVAVTWEPRRGTSGKPSAARVNLKATTPEGAVLFEGTLAPVRIGEVPDAAAPDRAEFDAPAGRVQLDMTIAGIGGEKLDVDGRDLDIPSWSGAIPIVLPAIMIPTQSAREFRQVAADANAAPDPSREFRRTERLVIRVPAYAAGAPVPVEARLLNRLGQPMRSVDALPAAAGGVTQFDLSLATLAPGDYYLLFTVAGPSGPVNSRVEFKVTG